MMANLENWRYKISSNSEISDTLSRQNFYEFVKNQTGSTEYTNGCPLVLRGKLQGMKEKSFVVLTSGQ